MKKLIAIISIFVGLHATAKAQDVYVSNGAKISFYSKTPMEDIDAVSTNVGAAMNIATRKLFFKCTISSFKFKNSLMQEHFNENYMESEKYPDAIFNATLAEDTKIDISKDGEIKTTASGLLKIHGVEKQYTVPVTLTVKGGTIIGKADFKVALEDHKIEVPTLVVAQIAKIIDVHVEANLAAKSK